VDYKTTYLPRIKRFLDAAKAKGIESLLFYSNVWRREDSRYLAGFNFLGPFNVVLITPDLRVRMGVSCDSDFRKAREELPWVDEVVLENPEMGRMATAWGEAGVHGKMGVSGLDLLPVRFLLQFRKSVPSVELVPITDIVNPIRLIKSPEELDLIRKSAALGDKAYDTFVESVREGRNAYEIMADVERTVKEGGAEDNFMIIGVGGVEVMAMAPPTDRVPVRGDQVLTEITPYVAGYCAQVCRTCVKGKPTAAQIKGFDIFLKAEDEAIRIMKPGVTVAEVAKAQNDVFRAHGFGDYVTVQYTRTRGHGLGLWQSEPPIINEESKAVLKENMVMIVHPNTYMPGVGYLVVGETVVVTRDGVDVLTRADRSLRAV
jgi:Xaa-Pro dipeptidase